MKKIKSNSMKMKKLFLTLTILLAINLVLTAQNCAEFDGDNGLYTNGAKWHYDSYSITFWADRPYQTWTPGTTQLLLHEYNSGVGGYYIWLTSANTIECKLITTAGTIVLSTPSTGLEDGPHNFGFTFSQSAGASLYIDGELVDSENNGGSMQWGTANFNVGMNNDNNNYFFYDGIIDDIRIFNDLYTTTDLQNKIFLKVPGTVSEWSDLRGWYPFTYPDYTNNMGNVSGNHLNWYGPPELSTKSLPVGTFPTNYDNASNKPRSLWCAQGTDTYSLDSYGLSMKASMDLGIYFYAYSCNYISGTSANTEITNAGVDIGAASIWFVDDNGWQKTASVRFDLSVFGAENLEISGLDPTYYKLLSRSGASGDFSIVASASSIIDGVVIFEDYDFGYDDAYITIGRACIEWEGSTSDWGTVSNWNPSTQPGSTNNVYIPNTATDPVIGPTETADCNNLIVESGGSLTIQSDATGTGSLIVQGTATGSVNTERYIEAATWGTWDDGWHFVSSPVADLDIATSNFVVATATDYDFYAWSEPDNKWINFKQGDTPSFIDVNGSDDFELGHGYLVAYKNTDTKLFTGNINVEDVTVSGITNTGGTTNYHSWHLLGNPFNSALTWDDEWTTTNIGGNIQIWNETGRSYTIIAADPGGAIPATNGFMVQGLDASTGSVTIPESKRDHSTQPFFKSAGFPIIKLKAINLDNPSFQESQLLFNPESSIGYEAEYDCSFLPGYAPLFYSEIDDMPMALNSMPNLEETTAIPFTFTKNEGLNFSIEMYEQQNLELDVWLLDKQQNKSQNLSENPVYTFTAFENDNPNRFVVHFSPVGLPETETISSPIQVYSNGKGINVINNNNLTGEITILNILGQQMDSFKLESNINQSHHADFPSGVYVVYIKTSDGQVYSEKVIVN